MINSKDISVVVQGAIDRENTPKCLASIRQYLPDAEIILSTWKGSNTEGLDYDILVLNEDPGATVCSKDGTVNNVNREIVSTRTGVNASLKKYVLKIRSDLILGSNKLLKINLQKYKRKSEFSYFKERLIVCSIYSRYYALRQDNIRTPILFHPSDWIYFGLKDDIFDLFNISLTNEPEFSQWFKDKPHTRNEYQDSHPGRLWKFSPEAYILTQYLRERHNICIQDKLDINSKLIELSNNVMVNNFYMADQIQLSLLMPKYKIKQHLMPRIDREGLYSNMHWHNQYRKYCDEKHVHLLTITALLNWSVDIFKIKRRKR